MPDLGFYTRSIYNVSVARCSPLYPSKYLSSIVICTLVPCTPQSASESRRNIYVTPKRMHAVSNVPKEKRLSTFKVASSDGHHGKARWCLQKSDVASTG